MGKRKTHATDDQYGEIRSQDRDTFQPPAARGGMRGGGGAGSSRRGNADLSFQRHVPKFLQPYAHMLGKQQQQQNEDEPVVANAFEAERHGAEAGEDDEGAGEAEAIQRALQDNPELAAEMGDRYLNKMRAQEEKAKGNAAFTGQDYEAAIKHFTTCIELDPRDAVYFSNRSAAYAQLGKYDEALTDAQAVLRLRPGWVKGQARLGAALYGLQQYSGAKEAYQKAMDMEPDDQALQRGYEKAMTMELKHMRDKKHIFKKAKVGAGGGGGSGGGGGASSSRAGGGSKGAKDIAPAAAGKPSMLSFAADEEEV